MSNVVRLPDSMERSWVTYERELRTILMSDGSSDAEIAHVVEVVRPAYLDCAQPYRIEAADMETALKELNAWVYKQAFGLLSRLVVAELMLYRAEQETIR